MAESPKAVRSRSHTRSPQLFAPSPKAHVDAQEEHGSDGNEPLVSPGRGFSPISAGKRLFKPTPRKVPRKVAKDQSILSKYLCQSLPAKISGVLSIVVVAIAVALFFGEPDGPKLVKRDAPLVPGDRLKGGQYISFCTSFIATGCKPKYLEVGRDGSLGVYGGSGPHARKAKLWSAGTGSSKGATDSSYELVYTAGRIVLNKDGKMKWSSSIKSLPKNMQPWPFAP